MFLEVVRCDKLTEIRGVFKSVGKLLDSHSLHRCVRLRKIGRAIERSEFYLEASCCPGRFPQAARRLLRVGRDASRS